MEKEIEIISSKNTGTFLNFREIWKFKDFLYFLVLKSIKGMYAQSILGIGWAVVQPLFQTLVFTIIFGNFIQLNSDNVPYFIFNLTAMIPWTYFSGVVLQSSNSLISNKKLLTKVYVPKLILPISAAFSKSIDLVIGIIILFICLIFYQIQPNLGVILLPFLIVLVVLSSLGLGMLFSALAIQFRDIPQLLNYLMRLLIYGVPIVYSIDVIPVKYYYLYALNPMVGVIEGFRSALLSTKAMPWDIIGISTVGSILLYLVGAYYFQKKENNFADVA